MLNRQIRITILILLTGFLIIWGRLTWLQVIRANHYANKPFEDRSFEAQLPRLIGAGVLVKGDEQFAEIDEEQIRAYLINQVKPENPEAYDHKRHRLYRQLKRYERMGSLIVNKNGQIALAPQTTLIRNPRIIAAETAVARGKILDRNGVVLAESQEGKRGSYKRVYPTGSLCSNFIGYTSIAYGSSGLERSFDELLTANPPKDLILTIDLRLQKHAYELLGEHQGAVVVLDVTNGEIIAMVSVPSFDTSQPPGKAWARALRDKGGRQFYNRAARELYPPGSTYKVVVAAAALAYGVVNPAEIIVCKGRHPRFKIGDHAAHGEVNFQLAFTKSCNVYFGELATKIGAEKLRGFAAKFGFGKTFDLANPTSLPFKLSSNPSLTYMPVVASRSMAASFKPHEISLIAQSGIGQHEVRVTPLQMAMVAGGIASGRVWQPTIIKAVPSPHSPREVEAIPPKIAAHVRDLMVEVMNSGTGRYLPKIYRTAEEKYIASRQSVKGAEAIRVGGKTGTAETGRKGEADHSWFIAFAPTENPRYAVSVIAERAGWGSVVAGPISIEILKEVLNLNR